MIAFDWNVSLITRSSTLWHLFTSISELFGMKFKIIYHNSGDIFHPAKIGTSGSHQVFFLRIIIGVNYGNVTKTFKYHFCQRQKSWHVLFIHGICFINDSLNNFSELAPPTPKQGGKGGSQAGSASTVGAGALSANTPEASPKRKRTRNTQSTPSSANSTPDAPPTKRRRWHRSSLRDFNHDFNHYKLKLSNWWNMCSLF